MDAWGPTGARGRAIGSLVGPSRADWIPSDREHEVRAGLPKRCNIVRGVHLHRQDAKDVAPGVMPYEPGLHSVGASVHTGFIV